MLFLTETHQPDAVVESWKKDLKFEHVFVVSTSSTSGDGLAMF